MTTAHIMTATLIAHSELTLGNEVGFINPRSVTGLSKADITELAKSIKTEGLVDPLRVWATEVNNVTYNVVIRGQRRYLAIGFLIEAGEAGALAKGVPIQYVECASLAEAQAKALLEFAQGKGLSTAEQAEALEHMSKLQGPDGKPMNGKAIAEALGKSTTWVSRIGNAYKKATPELREAWKAGKVTDEAAKGLAEIEEPAKQVEALQDFVETRATGTRDAKAKARGKATEAATYKKNGKGEAKPEKVASKVQRADIEDLAETLEKLTEANLGSPALSVMLSTLKWVLGDITEKKLPSEFHDALKAFEEAEAKKLKVGDEVTWKTQAGGNWEFKRGKVVEVVEPGNLPKAKVRQAAERSMEGYVVQTVDGKNFYPPTSAVERAKGNGKKEARA